MEPVRTAHAGIFSIFFLIIWKLDLDARGRRQGIIVVIGKVDISKFLCPVVCPQVRRKQYRVL